MKGVHISSIVNEAIRTDSRQFQILLREVFSTQKTQNYPKPTNKLKLNEYYTTKALIFRAQKLHRMAKIVFYFVFSSILKPLFKKI